MTVSDFGDITKGNDPERSLTKSQKRTGGRNNRGRNTSRFRGGGHKRRYRVVDFRRRDKAGVPAKVASIEYDPNRTANIALLHYLDGEKRYIIAPDKLEVGSRIVAGADAEPIIGNALPLRFIPVGTVIHNIELTPGKGAQLARSAGTSVQIQGRDGCRLVNCAACMLSVMPLSAQLAMLSTKILSSVKLVANVGWVVNLTNVAAQ